MAKIKENINSDINIIGSIPDYSFINEVIRYVAENFQTQDIVEQIINKNIFDIRTEKSRKRFLAGIISAFVNFKNESHRELVLSLFITEGFEKLKKQALFFQFAVNNKLFFLISKNILIKRYFEGRNSIKKEEISSYLFHLRESDLTIQSWTEETIETVASKYLTFLKKINFLTGSQTKEFIYLSPDMPTFIFFLYLIKAVEPDTTNILESKYLDFIFISNDAVADNLRKISLAEFFETTYFGNDIRIDLKYKFKDVINAISQRY
jgi:hypothetical protein